MVCQCTCGREQRRRTMPRRHSTKLLYRCWHSVGSSGMWCCRQSCAVRLSTRKQSLLSTQAARSCRMCWHCSHAHVSMLAPIRSVIPMGVCAILPIQPCCNVAGMCVSGKRREPRGALMRTQQLRESVNRIIRIQNQSEFTVQNYSTALHCTALQNSPNHPTRPAFALHSFNPPNHHHQPLRIDVVWTFSDRPRTRTSTSRETDCERTTP